jgi:hypothetical protein
MASALIIGGLAWGRLTQQHKQLAEKVDDMDGKQEVDHDTLTEIRTDLKWVVRHLKNGRGDGSVDKRT